MGIFFFLNILLLVDYIWFCFIVTIFVSIYKADDRQGTSSVRRGEVCESVSIGSVFLLSSGWG